MSDLYEVFNQENKRQPRAYDPEGWKEEQKHNREYCYETIEAQLRAVAKDGQIFKNYLDRQSHFDLYSPRNVLLIGAQRPQARKLTDAATWKEQGIYIKKFQYAHPILILEPGNQYERADGSTGQYYNAKKTYDISQTTAKGQVEAPKALDGRMLIKTLIAGAPVEIKPGSDIPEARNAHYDLETNTIHIRRGLEAPVMYAALAQELARAGYLKMTDGPKDIDFAAKCAGYMLCRQAQVGGADFSFEDVPQILGDFEP